MGRTTDHATNLQPATCNLQLLTDLAAQMIGMPRHLSVHAGGMLVTAQPLVEVVPLEHATKPGVVVAQWNKDSVEDAGLVKIDLLSLATLSMVSEVCALIAQRHGVAPGLDALPLDDPAIYRLLAEGDTIGCFQVESRAQSSMLPRLKPTCFDDLVIEVAIVRPGPIQGGMVHPYLRRRQGLEPVTYLHPSLEPALQETLGRDHLPGASAACRDGFGRFHAGRGRSAAPGDEPQPVGRGPGCSAGALCGRRRGQGC